MWRPAKKAKEKIQLRQIKTKYKRLVVQRVLGLIPVWGLFNLHVLSYLHRLPVGTRPPTQRYAGLVNCLNLNDG